MPRYFEGDEIHDIMTVTDDGTLVDPDEVYFEYREGINGDRFSVTPTRDGEGTYSAVVPIRKGGIAYFMKWRTVNPTRTNRRHVYVERDVFDDGEKPDYPPVGVNLGP